jgi:4-amino-4-deoxy-L-arabinose transferase-like glycosyltransferase
VFSAYYVTGRVAGWFGSPGDFRRKFKEDATTFYVLGRLLNVTAALVTIALVFRAVAPVGWLAAAAAALLVAVSPLHVGESSVAYTDVPATLLLTASMLALRSFRDRPTGIAFFVAGLLTGLGAAVKYYAVVGTAGITCAAMLSPVPVRQRLRLLALGAAGSMLGFVIGCPFSVLAFDEFSRELLTEMAHQREGHIGFDQSTNPLVGYFTNSLIPSIGVPALVAAAAGVWLVFRRHREFFPLLATAFGYLILTISTNVSFPRYAIPHVVMLSVLAGLALGRLRNLPVVASLAAAMILAVPAVRAGSVMTQRAMKDTRVVAEEWLEAHVPATARILASEDGPKYPAAFRISRFRPVGDRQFAAVHDGAVDVFVLTWSTTELMQDETIVRTYPEIARSHQALYQWVKTHATLEGRFLPDDVHQGPSIEVYMTPSASKSGRQTP